MKSERDESRSYSIRRLLSWLRVYPGKLTLFRARKQALFSSHAPDKGWGRLVTGGLEIKAVPGDHLGMLQEPLVRVLAQQLRDCLDKEQNETGS